MTANLDRKSSNSEYLKLVNSVELKLATQETSPRYLFLITITPPLRGISQASTQDWLQKGHPNTNINHFDATTPYNIVADRRNIARDQDMFVYGDPLGP